MFIAQEDSLKLKLLASGISPKVVQVVGNLRRSERQKEKEKEQAASRPGKKSVFVKVMDSTVKNQTGLFCLKILSTNLFLQLRQQNKI